jgi:glycogen(starch) synthase
LKILVLTNLYPPTVLGGYEIACHNVANAMRQRGHDVEVLTTWSHLPDPRPEPWAHRDLDAHWYLPYTSSDGRLAESEFHKAVCSSYRNTLMVLNYLRSILPDIVYVWNTTGIGTAAILDLLNMVGVPWVLHLMDRTPVDVVANVEAGILGLFGASGSSLYRSAGVISMSEHLLTEIEELGGITFPGATIIPGGADTSNIAAHENYLRGGKARFVASAVSAEKGTDLIIEAAVKLKLTGADFLIDIFGPGELPRYIDIVRNRGLEGQVRFLGPVAQRYLLEQYPSYDVFLFPTWDREPFGFAPIEAAACGTPPIMSRNCGASERLVDLVHCIKIDRTVGDLLDAMQSVCSAQIDLSAMGRRAKRLVLADLSFNAMLDRIEATLTQRIAPWSGPMDVNDSSLSLLAYLKHNLSIMLRFG